MLKKKSLAVVLLSGFIISSVLVLTLVAYVIYVELKDKESRIAYKESLKQIRAIPQKFR